MGNYSITPPTGLLDTSVYPGESNPRDGIMDMVYQLLDNINAIPEASGTLAASGQIKIPIGSQTFILKWGTATTQAETSDSGLYTASVTVTFSESFPNACVKCNHNPTNMNLAFPTYAKGSKTTASFYLTSTISGQCGVKPIEWWAIGY